MEKLVGMDNKLGLGVRSESSLIGNNGNPKNEKLLIIRQSTEWEKAIFSFVVQKIIW